VTIYDPADERFGHQIPEPFRHTAIRHHFWRESLFFIMHSSVEPNDVLILTLAHFPERGEMDSLQLGRTGSEPILARHDRKVNGDHDRMAVGPVTIDVVEPLKVMRLSVVESAQTPVSLDVVFTARTQPYGLRRGTMSAADEVIWDQRHMFQSGWFTGTYTRDGITHTLDKWWGQRDHSWGIRNHARCPMWMWLAIQVPEGMYGVWCWEYPNGARVYMDGCFAPADGSEPIPIVAFEHDMTWLDESGTTTSYERYGDHVAGLSGQLKVTLQGGKHTTITASGRWAQRYSWPHQTGLPDTLGGGLSEMTVETSDGTRGTAIFEITGQWHHKYFPYPRGEKFPPYGYTPREDEHA
jgi:hypothetical protein